MVEPVSGRVLAVSSTRAAEGSGRTAERLLRHPLQHAVMRVIDAMAARDRALWPVAERTTVASSALPDPHLPPLTCPPPPLS
jgi:hypothetical protein